jgi:hypothetical protein
VIALIEDVRSGAILKPNPVFQIGFADDGRNTMPITQNFRYSCRQLVNNPGSTVMAMSTLALGIGAPTAMYTVL